MILVLLGTFHIEFKRPLIALEKLYSSGILKEEVIVQSGYTQYPSEYFKLRPFLSMDELDTLYNNARIIISQAGTGSIIKGLKKQKTIIAIARLKKYNEVVDDHQLELLDEFSKSGFIIPWHEEDNLEHILKIAENFKPKEYRSEKKAIILFLQQYIDQL